MTERAIIYLDTVKVNLGHDDALPLVDGWEIHVRREDGRVDILFLAPSKANQSLYDLRCDGESWGRFANTGDAFMQALDPHDPETYGGVP